MWDYSVELREWSRNECRDVKMMGIEGTRTCRVAFQKADGIVSQISETVETRDRDTSFQERPTIYGTQAPWERESAPPPPPPPPPPRQRSAPAKRASREDDSEDEDKVAAAGRFLTAAAAAASAAEAHAQHPLRYIF